jgi:GNAT superfamily N-acetyltransferase
MTAAPPVYAPGAPICLIDDFCVDPANAWASIGGALLDAAIEEGRRRGAPLTSIVAAHLDAPKRAFLASRGFAVTSEWHVRDNR